MKRNNIIMHMLALLSCAFCMASCDVHEFPDIPEKRAFHLRLNYDTDMTEWKHLYDGENMIEEGLGETYDNHRDYGKIRYIVRTYPVSEKMRTTSDYTQEFVFTKDISEGYDHEVTLDLLPGNYNVMVWSDLVQTSSDSHFYNADNFAEIRLQGDHKGNNDYRDAFRGSNNISLVADIIEHQPDTLDIAMQRPLAKFEFVTNDVVELVDERTFRWTGRYDHVINSGGVKIFPERVEQKIARLLTRRFFIAAAPDEKWGQCVALAIEGDPLSPADEAALLAHIREVVDRYEVPRRVVYLPVFAETSSGKVIRHLS